MSNAPRVTFRRNGPDDGDRDQGQRQAEGPSAPLYPVLRPREKAPLPRPSRASLMGAVVAAEAPPPEASKYDFRAIVSLGALGLGTYLLMTYDPVKKMDLSSRHLRDHDEFGNLKKPKTGLKGAPQLAIKTVAPAKKKVAMVTGEEDIEDEDDDDDDEDIEDDLSDLEEDDGDGDDGDDGDLF